MAALSAPQQPLGASDVLPTASVMAARALRPEYLAADSDVSLVSQVANWFGATFGRRAVGRGTMEEEQGSYLRQAFVSGHDGSMVGPRHWLLPRCSL